VNTSIFGSLGGTVVRLARVGLRSGASGRALAAVLVAAALALTSACNETTGTRAATAENAKPAAPRPKAAVISIKNVGVKPQRPDTEITVIAGNGTLTSVEIIGRHGGTYRGKMSIDSTTWHFDGGLPPGSSYRLVATAVGTDGRAKTRKRAFTTTPAASTISASISPRGGVTVGVGQPVIVEFSSPVTNRAAVEERLAVTASTPVIGAWHWISDTEVRYRPRDYWPGHTDVTVTAALTGVEASRGVWGTSAKVGRFKIGRSMVSIVDLKRHAMKVYEDGKLLRTIPVTGGKPGYTSRSGIKVVLGKIYYTVMDGESIGIPKDSPDYYRLDVYYAVQVTRSGEYVHAAPWSTWAQGKTNVSHGCIGMSTSNGRWFYDRSIVGDVVKTTGTDKRMELDNGFGDWNLSWSAWLAGSALQGSSPANGAADAATSYSRSGP
jgi:lipoprotein-anchoring transpeptidase ErfK/SrfK